MSLRSRFDDRLLRVRRAGPDDLAALFSVRHEVFTLGQGVPVAVERDGRDAEALHVIAEVGGRVLGTGRLVRAGDTGLVGRMAVLPDARGAGIGTRLLAALEDQAMHAGLREVELHAQWTARRFYQRAGYRPTGPTYLEANIEHVTMHKELPMLRPARDNDSAALIDLISSCWAEYPGCVMDVDAEERWLREPATAYGRWRGRLWVVELAGRVVACVGMKPTGLDAAELKSLYVAPSARRRGLGKRLSLLVEHEARRRGAGRLILWSDTRFTDAHRLYERLGYRRLPGTRELHDRSESVEYGYVRPLAP